MPCWLRNIMKAAQRVQSLEPAISGVAFDLPTRQRGSPKGIPRVVSVLLSVTIDRAVAVTNTS